jgi:hypothetical protein
MDKPEPNIVGQPEGSGTEPRGASIQKSEASSMPASAGGLSPELSDKQFRVKLTIFWVGVIAAIIAAFAVGYPGWENYIAQEAAKRQLRAYIDVRPKGMTTIEEGMVPRVRDSFQNIGRTPAFHDGAFSRLTVAEYPLTHKLSNEECSPISTNPKANKWFIGKASGPEIVRETPFTASEVEAIKSGNAAVYMHGRVCYRDIFNEPHRTEFCLHWKWVAGRMSPGLYCDQGNSSN